MRLIDEIAYQYKIAKIPMEERTFVKAWETAQDMPTIDAAPVVRGEWISKGGCRCDCSVCGGSVLGRADRTGWADSAFCGYCGANMESEA